ncbi:uncharacterized protein LOC108477434 isoform X1 [Gossypium arboreum]|uniref:uncharacterized protein LOC108477434 isoform X1 n=1 Tax=Gossypium arboreum TaxID=29729 RepID=UPI0022F1D6A9|nr:uncharacterized protein LOC108477434 isoform X1 [Gossypium arboreum]
MGAYRTEGWDTERRGSDLQSGNQFEYHAFPQTLDELELEFKIEAMELGRIRDKEEDERIISIERAIVPSWPTTEPPLDCRGMLGNCNKNLFSSKYDSKLRYRGWMPSLIVGSMNFEKGYKKSLNLRYNDCSSNT